MKPPTVRIITTTYRVVDDGHGGSTTYRNRNSSRWYRYSDVDGPLAAWLAETVTSHLGYVEGAEVGRYYGEPKTDTQGITTERFASFRNVSDEVEYAAHELIIRKGQS